MTLKQSAGRTAALVLFVLAPLGCSDDALEPVTAPAIANGSRLSIASTPNAVVPIKSIALSPATASLLIGASRRFTATVVDLQNAPRTDLTLTWVSEDPRIATITTDGVVTARAAGTTRIAALYGLVWASTTANGLQWGTATVTVTAPTTSTPPTGSGSPPPESSWTFCTNAGAPCDFIGLRDVRLGGPNGPYVVMTASRSVPCAVYGFNNQNPAPNQPLHCDYGPVKTTTLNNPMPGMSGFSPTVVTVPLGAVGSSTSRTTSGAVGALTDGTGAFRTTCSMSGFSFIDPIVYPGAANSSHLHLFFGNTGINPNSTPASIASTGNSTCRGGTLNRSSYWVPAVFDARNGQVQIPDEGIFYYKTGWNVDPATVEPFPVGLRMIAGNKNATGLQAAIEWSCRNKYVPNTGAIPTACAVGDAVRMVIRFPQCWDGRTLDSPDHQSHMAYPSYRGLPSRSVCPPSHPVVLPEITEIIDFPISSSSSPANWRLTSDMYSLGAKGGYSLHADWMNGWDAATMQTIVRQCLNKALDCGVGSIGNGLVLY